MDCLQQGFFCEISLTDNLGETSLLKRFSIQDLVAPGSVLVQRNEDGRLVERQNLMDNVRAGAGDDNVSCREYMRELFVQIFELLVARSADEALVQLAIATYVYDLILLQDVRQSITDGFVNNNRA